MAVVIMGIAFVIIVGGIAMAIIGSDIQKQQTGADVALRTAAEKIVDVTYVPCQTVAGYQVELTPVTGFDLSVSGVSYWNKPLNKYEEPVPPDTCMSAGMDTGLQLVELTATATGGRAVPPVVLQVVKRQP